MSYTLVDPNTNYVHNVKFLQELRFAPLGKYWDGNLNYRRIIRKLSYCCRLIRNKQSREVGNQKQIVCPIML